MKTSKIVIRPFQTFNEPVATLIFGNVTIELEYSAMITLGCLDESDINTRLHSTISAGVEEIKREMKYEMTAELPVLHRDSDAPWLQSITSNPLHPINGEVLCHKDKGRFDTENQCPYGSAERINNENNWEIIQQQINKGTYTEPSKRAKIKQEEQKQ